MLSKINIVIGCDGHDPKNRKFVAQVVEALKHSDLGWEYKDHTGGLVSSPALALTLINSAELTTDEMYLSCILVKLMGLLKNINSVNLKRLEYWLDAKCPAPHNGRFYGGNHAFPFDLVHRVDQFKTGLVFNFSLSQGVPKPYEATSCSCSYLQLMNTIKLYQLAIQRLVYQVSLYQKLAKALRETKEHHRPTATRRLLAEMMFQASEGLKLIGQLV